MSRLVFWQGLQLELFWIPVSYVYHNVFSIYSRGFIENDIATRIIGSAIGDGLLGAALGYVILRTAIAINKRRSLQLKKDAVTPGTVKKSYSGHAELCLPVVVLMVVVAGIVRINVSVPRGVWRKSNGTG